jgi:hypothetical protein
MSNIKVNDLQPNSLTLAELTSKETELIALSGRELDS